LCPKQQQQVNQVMQQLRHVSLEFLNDGLQCQGGGGPGFHHHHCKTNFLKTCWRFFSTNRHLPQIEPSPLSQKRKISAEDAEDAADRPIIFQDRAEPLHVRERRTPKLTRRVSMSCYSC
jgi:hypothetical protein